MKYKEGKIRDFCAEHNMLVDEDGLTLLQTKATKHKITQAAFDDIGIEYANRVMWLFSPKAYSWKARILLAMHFIFNPKGL